jgi:hypothetical protein
MAILHELHQLKEINVRTVTCSVLFLWRFALNKIMHFLYISNRSMILYRSILLHCVHLKYIHLLPLCSRATIYRRLPCFFTIIRERSPFCFLMLWVGVCILFV